MGTLPLEKRTQQSHPRGRRILYYPQRFEPDKVILHTLLQLLAISLHAAEKEPQTPLLAGDVGAEDPEIPYISDSGPQQVGMFSLTSYPPPSKTGY